MYVGVGVGVGVDVDVGVFHSFGQSSNSCSYFTLTDTQLTTTTFVQLVQEMMVDIGTQRIASHST